MSYRMLIGAFALSQAVLAAESPQPDIAGRWITFDGSHRRAIVEISRESRHATGRIVEFFPRPGEDPDPACDECPPPSRGRKIRGLQILSLDADDHGGWHGTVVDPEEGREYRCTVSLEGASQLRLRGYVGLPLFGRTEAWRRAD